MLFNCGTSGSCMLVISGDINNSFSDQKGICKLSVQSYAWLVAAMVGNMRCKTNHTWQNTDKHNALQWSVSGYGCFVWQGTQGPEKEKVCASRAMLADT